MSMRFTNVRERLYLRWKRDIRPLLIVATVLFSLRSSLADWNDVPTGSMVPTILVGDRILVNKLAYDLKVPFTTVHLAEWAEPQRGEVVVFYSPHDGQRLVKRVVGLPGDIVELRQNRLYLNGDPSQYSTLPEIVLRDVSAAERQLQVYGQERLGEHPHAIAVTPFGRSRSDFAPFHVPASHYFMMGDNRDQSFDSRYFGPVPRDRIIGRAEAVVFSFNRPESWVPRLSRFFSRLDQGLGERE